MMPPWVKHFPPGRTAKCEVCGETDLRLVRYFINGFRCVDHRPGARPECRHHEPGIHRDCPVARGEAV